MAKTRVLDHRGLWLMHVGLTIQEATINKRLFHHTGELCLRSVAKQLIVF